MASLSKEALKSALIELAQSDRAFFASLIADLMSGEEPAESAEPEHQNAVNWLVGADGKLAKISPSYRIISKAERKKYAMDKRELSQLQDLFADAPAAEEFMQTTKG